MLQNDDAHSDCMFARTVVCRRCELGMAACEAALKHQNILLIKEFTNSNPQLTDWNVGRRRICPDLLMSNWQANRDLVYINHKRVCMRMMMMRWRGLLEYRSWQVVPLSWLRNLVAIALSTNWWTSLHLSIAYVPVVEMAWRHSTLLLMIIGGQVHLRWLLILFPHGCWRWLAGHALHTTSLSGRAVRLNVGIAVSSSILVKITWMRTDALSVVVVPARVMWRWDLRPRIVGKIVRISLMRWRRRIVVILRKGNVYR